MVAKRAIFRYNVTGNRMIENVLIDKPIDF